MKILIVDSGGKEDNPRALMIADTFQKCCRSHRIYCLIGERWDPKTPMQGTVFDIALIHAGDSGIWTEERDGARRLAATRTIYYRGGRPGIDRTLRWIQRGMTDEHPLTEQEARELLQWARRSQSPLPKILSGPHSKESPRAHSSTPRKRQSAHDATPPFECVGMTIQKMAGMVRRRNELAGMYYLWKSLLQWRDELDFRKYLDELRHWRGRAAAKRRLTTLLNQRNRMVRSLELLGDMARESDRMIDDDFRPQFFNLLSLLSVKKGRLAIPYELWLRQLKETLRLLEE